MLQYTTQPSYLWKSFLTTQNIVQTAIRDKQGSILSQRNTMLPSSIRNKSIKLPHFISISQQCNVRQIFLHIINYLTAYPGSGYFARENTRLFSKWIALASLSVTVIVVLRAIKHSRTLLHVHNMDMMQKTNESVMYIIHLYTYYTNKERRILKVASYFLLTTTSSYYWKKKSWLQNRYSNAISILRAIYHITFIYYARVQIQISNLFSSFNSSATHVNNKHLQKSENTPRFMCIFFLRKCNNCGNNHVTAIFLLKTYSNCIFAIITCCKFVKIFFDNIR